MPALLTLIRWCLAGLLLVTGTNALGCPPADTAIRNRFPVGFYPVSHNTRINGLAFGFMEETWNGATRLQINGVALQLNPASVFFAVCLPGVLLWTPPSQLKRPDEPVMEDGIRGSSVLTDRVFDEPSSQHNTDINGVALGSGLFGETVRLNGIAVGFAHAVESVKGVQVSVVQSQAVTLDGVSISVRNKATRVRGLQIGLYNTCRDGYVVQIGLLNRIGRRLLPFCNLQFGGRKKAGTLRHRL